MRPESPICIEQDSDAVSQAFEEQLAGEASGSLLSSLLRGSAERPAVATIQGVVVGELLALADDGCTPLVCFAGQAGSRAIAARSSIDLRGPHIGRQVVLMFENADPARPIVMGLLQGVGASPRHDGPDPALEIESDGDRLVVAARNELVLRCGKARITLTKAGKVLIEGSYVLSRSTGVNRVKGGSVQLN